MSFFLARNTIKNKTKNGKKTVSFVQFSNYF